MPASAAPPSDIIALLGRADAPTDALVDYCWWLGQAVAERGVILRVVRVAWAERGWGAALWTLACDCPAWRGTRVLIQYTALQWSRRGIPIMLLAVLWLLRHRGVRLAMVFHDPEPYPERVEASWVRRQVDRARARLQRSVMRLAFSWTERSIFTVPPAHLRWLPRDSRKARFVPVGPNLPEPDEIPDRRPRVAERVIVVYAVTAGEHLQQEVADINFVVRRAVARVPALRLTVLGRNADAAWGPLRRALDGAPVEVSVLGLLPAEQVAQTLAGGDVQLFVRGPLTTGRGSVIAGVACGLPVVGYTGPETDRPLTEAGVVAVPAGDREALAAALIRVLTDETLRLELRRRSLAAHRTYFSWDVIAGQLLAELADD